MAARRKGLDHIVWDTLDLSIIVNSGVDAVWRMRGVPAPLATAFVCAVIAYVDAYLVIYFDLLPTYQYTSEWLAIIVPALPAIALEYSGYLAIAATVFPTLIELVGSIFNKVGLKAFVYLFWVFLVFDAITDWSAVKEFVAVLDPQVLSLPGDPIIMIGLRMVFLLLATAVFEVLFIALAITAIAGMIRAFLNLAGVAQKAAGGGYASPTGAR